MMASSMLSRLDWLQAEYGDSPLFPLVRAAPMPIAALAERAMCEREPELIVFKCARTFEIITRLYCFIGMADRQRPSSTDQKKKKNSKGEAPKSDGQKPYEFGSALQRPSLGVWLASLRNIAAIEGHDPAYRKEAERFIERVERTGIITCRNGVAHSLGSANITSEQLTQIREGLGGWLEDAEWFGSLYWVAGRADGRIVRIDKLGSLDHDVPSEVAPGCVLLGHRDRRINLTGWLHLETNDDEQRPGSVASLHIYDGYEQRQIQYSVLEVEDDGGAAFSYVQATRPMLHTPEVFAWVDDQKKVLDDIPSADKEFLDIVEKHTTVRRDLSVYTRTLEKASGVVLFSGIRGSGKTNFLAQLWNWQRTQSDDLRFTFSIGSSVGSGDAQQFLVSFHRFLIKSGIIQTKKRATNIAQIRSEIAQAAENIRQPVTVFLDNVHRALRDQPEIVDLMALTSGSMLWVCSTREGNASVLKQRLLPVEYDVPGFTTQEIILYLDGLGGNASQLLCEMGDNGTKFIDLLAEQSAGNPTYVESVHNDLRSRPISKVMNDLPQGIKKWIERNYLEKEAKNDFERREADIRWMVAATFAPISLETVLHFLGEGIENRIHLYREAFNLGTPEVIQDRNKMLRFRDSILGEVLGSSDNPDLNRTKMNIAERAKGFHGDSVDKNSATTKYLFEYGCRHLAWQRSFRVGQRLLSDLRYLINRFDVLGHRDTPVEQLVQAITRDWAVVLDEDDPPEAYVAWRAESHILSRLQSYTEARAVLEQVTARWNLTPDLTPRPSNDPSAERLVQDPAIPMLDGITVLAGHHFPITLMRTNPWQTEHMQFVSVDAVGTVMVWDVRWADSISPPAQASQGASVVIDAVWLMIDTLALLYDNGALFLWSVGKDGGRVKPLTEVHAEDESGFSGLAANPRGSEWCLAWTRGGTLVSLSLTYGAGHRTVVAKEVARADEQGGIFGASVVDRGKSILVLAWSLAGSIQPMDPSLRPVMDRLDFGPPVRSFSPPGQSGLLLQDAFHRVMWVGDDVRIDRRKIGDILTVDWRRPARPVAWTADGPHLPADDPNQFQARSDRLPAPRLVRAVPVSSGVLAVDTEGRAHLLDETRSRNIRALERVRLQPGSLPLPFGGGGGVVDGMQSKLWLWDDQDHWTASLDSPVRLVLSLSNEVFATASDDHLVRLYRKKEDWSRQQSIPLLSAAVAGLAVMPSGIVLAWDGTEYLTMIGRPGDDDLIFDQWTNVRCCDGRLAGLLRFDDGILTWGEDGVIRHWEVPALGRLRHVRDIGYHGAGVAGAFIYENDRLVSWSADGTVGVWPLSSDGRHRVQTFSDFLDGVKDVIALSNERLYVRTADDRWFACFLADASFMLWKSPSTESLSATDDGPSKRCNGSLNGSDVVWTSTWVAVVDPGTNKERMRRWYSRETITKVEIWGEKAVVVGCADGSVVRLVIGHERTVKRKRWS